MPQHKVYTMMPVPDCSQIATSTNLAEAIKIALQRSKETHHPYGIYVGLNHLVSCDGSLDSIGNIDPAAADYGTDDESSQIQALENSGLAMQEATIAMYESTIKELLLHIKQLKGLACRDALTGLYNRRYLSQRIKAEFKRARRYKEPLSCTMLDIDSFKKVNDTHGHPFGDYVLSELAGFFRRSFRETDIITRYGGDEFCIILPQTSHEDAIGLMKKITDMANALLTRLDEVTPGIGLSHGVATSDEQVSTPLHLIEKADTALRWAKEEKEKIKLAQPKAQALN